MFHAVGNNGGSGRKQERKMAQASSRKGCMRGKGGPENASCTYKGVRQRTWGKWVSEIREPNRGSRVWLGTFNSAREAAIAYDSAARRLYGPNAHVNLPEETENAPPPPPAVTEAAKEARYHRAIEQMKKQQEFERRIQIYMHQQQQQQMMRVKVESPVEIPDLNGQAVGGYYNNNNYYCNYNNIIHDKTGDNFVDPKSSTGNLNANLPEFDDSRLWTDAASTMDYESQAIDPGIGASTFNDTIGIELNNPLMIGSLNIGRTFNIFVRGYLCNFVINIHFYQSSHTHIGFSLIFLSPPLPTPLAIRFPSFYAFLCHCSLPSSAILLELKIGSFVAGFGDAGGEEPLVTDQRGVVRKRRDSNSEDGYSNLVSTSNATDLLDAQKKKKAEKEASNEKLKRPHMKSGHTPQSLVKSGK
uniref:uncharacterized protein LOC122608948 n=1 Tax=Erigeron canadensis TaxID=72917 RepID=UPI001CB8F356|nr:uncharacterized protein LOC122608948 [Erigeron canadensis]